MSYSPAKQPRTQAAAEIRHRISKGLLDLKEAYPMREEYIPEKDLSQWVTWDAVRLWIEESGIEFIDKKNLRMKYSSMH